MLGIYNIFCRRQQVPLSLILRPRFSPVHWEASSCIVFLSQLEFLRFIVKLFETYNGTQSLYFLLEPALGGDRRRLQRRRLGRTERIKKRITTDEENKKRTTLWMNQSDDNMQIRMKQIKFVCCQRNVDGCKQSLMHASLKNKNNSPRLKLIMALALWHVVVLWP